MNKKTLIVAVVLVLVAALLVGVYYLTRPGTSKGEKAFTLEIVHADGTSKKLPMKSSEEYLGTYLQNEGIISGEMGQYGLYIKIVDGEKAVYEEDNAYWGFYVDGEYAVTGIDLTPIEDGRTYKLEYTKG